MKDIALEYFRKFGFNIIPVKPDKKPYIKWEKYQTQRITHEEVVDWWTKWPKANIGIVTGETSQLVVIDADSETAKQEIEKIVPELTPTVKSPKGWHFYCNSNGEDLGNAVRFLPDCDLRGQGGYIIAPPSINAEGIKYKQLSSFELIEAIPIAITLLLSRGGFGGGDIRDVAGECNKAQQDATKRNIGFEKGTRDESLFYLANHLVKSGMKTVDIEYYLRFCASHCSPPYPEKEIPIKIASALKRADKREKNITQEIREMILQQNGNISATSCYIAQQAATKNEKSAIRMALSRFAKEGLLEPTGRNAGEYRIVESAPEPLDWKKAKEDWAKLYLPWKLSDFIYIPEGGLILLMGNPNAGKSAALINIARYNMRKKWNVHYLSTEVSEGSFKKRAEAYGDISLDDWNINFYYDPPIVDTIKGGKGNLWLIDYIELYSEFWEVGKILSDIHRKLDGGVAICAIQKQPGSDIGLGGQFTQFKPALTLAMEWQKVKIIKAKDYSQSHFETYGNPNGKEYSFKMIDNRTRYIEERWWTTPFNSSAKRAKN